MSTKYILSLIDKLVQFLLYKMKFSETQKLVNKFYK